MFKDSKIAQDFKMSKTKCSYLINFGLAPRFRDVLFNNIKESPYFSVAFDEALNKCLQKQQMDVVIRYWCEKNNRVKVRYWDSQFQHGAAADTLLNGLNNSLSKHDTSKMIQLSMDGPNVNWAILRKMQEQRAELEIPDVEDIGSCGLHVVSGAFQNGVKVSEWDLDKVLRSMWKLLDKSPARRGVYLRLCDRSPPLFPLKFCATRWVENEKVANRAIDVWSSMVLLIKDFLLKPVSKRPSGNVSYDTLVKMHKDPIMPVKLHIFRDVASKLNTFLVTFQSDAPLVPFLSDALEILLRRFMDIFMLRKVMKEADTPYKLINIDLEDNAKQKPMINVTLPTSVVGMVANEQKEAIKKNFVKLLKKMVAKMQERCPLKYALVRNASSLSPVNMARGDGYSNLFQKLVNQLHLHKRFSANVSDAAKEQYDLFLEVEVEKNVNKFKKFDINSQRLDEFLGTYMVGEPKYKELWQVCKFVFVFTFDDGTEFTN